ncbi:RF-1 domain-containing protein [Daldinia decipiens]|uniref:RF-1 domain-containing protein n=1 Tax=Daldinia decipiens TaxID=326647 RepID=UPI0020C42F19|nr:RF-1 domain-containing protein [Daldinia decipiens]KAI1663070.1 RF-1 domain-containing protein [Daldinia decipiens]
MPSLLLRLQPFRNYLPSISRPSHIYSATAIASRPSSFSASPPLLKNTNLPPRPKPPPEEDIEESFLKGSGPGGQKINKTNSAVQLKHLPTGLVVKSQATRSRSQNRVIARQLLADKLDDLARGGESRSAVVGEFKRKKKASSAKKSRRKYRKLDGEKQQVQAGTALQEEEALEEEEEEEEEEEFEDGGGEKEFPDSSRSSERIEHK